MTNNVTTFNFNTNPIRVVEIDANPWFVAADVCKTLQIQLQAGGEPNVTVALRKLDQDEVSLYRIQGNSGERQVKIISESGLYKLVMRSDKPQAKAFQDWVTREVLPSIRKTGAYVVGQPSIQQNPDMDHLELAAAQVVALQKIIAPGFTTKL